MRRWLRREKLTQRIARGDARVNKHIFTTTMLPAIAYGAPVRGVSNTELNRIEIVAGRCLAPTCKGVSRIARLSAYRGPLDALSTAALHRLACEVWAARARSVRALSLPALRAVWNGIVVPYAATGSNRAARFTPPRLICAGSIGCPPGF